MLYLCLVQDNLKSWVDDLTEEYENTICVWAVHMPLSPRPPLDQESNLVTQAGVVSKRRQATCIAPKTEDTTYKTTPCRHTTLNYG